jgi:hypothetical protein
MVSLGRGADSPDQLHVRLNSVRLGVAKLPATGRQAEEGGRARGRGPGAGNDRCVGDGQGHQPVRNRSVAVIDQVGGDRRLAVCPIAAGSASTVPCAPTASLSLVDATAGIAVEDETGPRDEDLSGDGRFLYVVNADSRRIFGWAVGDDGTLSCTAIAA